MNPIAIGVLILVLLGGGALLLTQGSSSPTEEAAMMEKKSGEAMEQKEDGMMADTDDAMMKKTDGAMVDEASMEKKDEGAMMQKGSYEPYAAEKLAKAHEGDVVLFFRASWCPTCRALDADIRANADTIPGGLTILDVNYDTETALKQKYGVTSQHTLVQVSSDGSLIKKWQGSANLAALVTQVK